MSGNEKKLISGLPHINALAWEFYCQLNLKHTPNIKCNVLLGDESLAYDFKEALSVFFPEDKIYLLSPLECDLLRGRGPSLPTRVERINFYSKYYANEDGVFLFPASSLLQRGPSSKHIQKKSLQIKKGQNLTRQDLIDFLVSASYLPSEVVESPFHFAARGSLVDVFSANYQNPLRIEILEDEIHSIRLFHPSTQRRIDELDEILLLPAREFSFPEASSISQQKNKLKKIMADNNWPRAEQDAFLNKIEHQSFFNTIDYWGPLLEGKEEGAPTWHPQDFHACVGVDGLAVKLKLYRERLEKYFNEASIEGEWVPPPRSFLYSYEETLDSLQYKYEKCQTFLSTSFQIPDTNETKEYRSQLRSHDRLAQQLSAARAESHELPLFQFSNFIKESHREGIRHVIVSSSASQLERLHFLLSNYSLDFKSYSNWEELDSLPEFPAVSGLVANLDSGFIDHTRKFSFIGEQQILGTKKKKNVKNHTAFQTQGYILPSDLGFLDFKVGDLLVHKQHGVGKYLGSKSLVIEGMKSELLEIEYKDANKLLLPVSKLSLVQKYTNSSAEMALDKLGGSSWETKKTKAKKEILQIAGDLLSLYAKREMAVGPSIQVAQEKTEEFAATFPYEETPDQAKAIEAVIKDLRGPKPMDRLVCGDVGYGKTEVAVRAVFQAHAAGFQSAILCPTTLLCLQHESTFKKRLRDMGIQVASLSRFNSTKENKEIVEGLKSGSIRVVVGTHKLFSSEVSFHNLGLLVVDEEQRFGVAHKEKIKRLRNNVHVLTLTATPIPRTLNLSMAGIKDISLMTTPPSNRMSVKTTVAKKRDALIKEAIENEMKRGGQVYYLHNRVLSMRLEYERLKNLLPSAKIEMAHGQMKESELEEVMLRFYQGKIDVLLCTAIIESGLDVPTANTLIVDRADTFGLSQLYQIRGRVGRSEERAFAYFLLPETGSITKEAEERLSVLENYQELGSGFHIASHDLDIRGAGDLLGHEQSGQVQTVGFDTYVQLLQECVAELRGEHLESDIDPDVQLGIEARIDESYIPELGLRLMFYRKLSSAHNEEEVDAIEVEIEDRFGPASQAFKNLITQSKIKCQLRRLRITQMRAGAAGFSLHFDSKTPVDVQKLLKTIKDYPQHYQLTPEGKLLIKKPLQDNQKNVDLILQRVGGALAQIESWCSVSN